MTRQDEIITLALRVSSLERHNRWLRQVIVFITVFTVAVTAATLPGFGGREAKPEEAECRIKTYDEITVGRINIAGPDGVNRFILSHEMPHAPFQGETLERSVPPGMAGMIYCAPNGDEVGGIGVSGTDRGGHALITLDYRNTPLEAIGLSTQYTSKNQSAFLVVMDNPTDIVDMKKIKANDKMEIERLQAMMVDRIALGVSEHEASLVIKDRDGKDRIVIGVDAGNNPTFVIFDKNGQAVLRLPAK